MKRTLTLAGIDKSLSPFALGCTKAGRVWRGKEADELLNAYVDRGGNVLDTARIYGLPKIGASEAVIGEWLANSHRRDEVVLMSKGGHPNVTSMHTSRMSQQEMEADLDASLRALRTDRIDVYFYHRDDPAQPVEVLIERMEGFRKAGKVLTYACSNWSTERMQQADAYAHAHGMTGFVGNECLYNIASDAMKPMRDDTMRKVDADMLAYHAGGTQNLLMPYSGLCEGFFHKLAKGGMLVSLEMLNNPYHTEENLRVAKHIGMLREKYGATVSQVLAGFFYTHEVPMLPLFGCSSVQHMDELMKAAEMPFSAEDYNF